MIYHYVWLSDLKFETQRYRYKILILIEIHIHLHSIIAIVI